MKDKMQKANRGMLKASAILVVIVTISLFSFENENKKEAQAAKSPNIIFILTDDQGWTQTSHRADPDIPESKSDYYETPNIDKLAKSGVMFTQGYAPNPICSPTRNSLMFGQNAARHIYNKDADWYKKTQDWLTIPRAIKKANPNYRTAHFGKWHIAMVPKDAGFDSDDGMTSNSGGEIFGDGYLDAKDYTEAADTYMKENKVENPTNTKRAGKPSAHWNDKNPKDIFGITERATEFMKESIKEDRPFYVQLSHYATHLSLVSGKESYEYFKKKSKGEQHSTPEFAAMLKDMDTSIGMVMDFVKEAGIEDNTYIFLMGDNGGRSTLNQVAVIDENKQLESAYYSRQNDRNNPLRDGKHSFYEGGLRVPFMVSGPNIKANRVSRVPVTGLDFLPTFASIAGFAGKFPEYIDGGNLIPLLQNESVNEVNRSQKALIFHQSSHRPPRSAIRKGNYKLIKYWSNENKYKNTPKVELYDLANDLSESKDLSANNPEKTKELENELTGFLEEVNAETGVRDIDGAFYRLLRDLGADGSEEE